MLTDANVWKEHGNARRRFYLLSVFRLSGGGKKNRKWEVLGFGLGWRDLLHIKNMNYSCGRPVPFSRTDGLKDSRLVTEKTKINKKQKRKINKKLKAKENKRQKESERDRKGEKSGGH